MSAAPSPPQLLQLRYCLHHEADVGAHLGSLRNALINLGLDCIERVLS